MALVQQMIDDDPQERPSAAAVEAHPIFWSGEKQRDFFCVRRPTDLLFYN